MNKGLKHFRNKMYEWSDEDISNAAKMLIAYIVSVTCTAAIVIPILIYFLK